VAAREWAKKLENKSNARGSFIAVFPFFTFCRNETLMSLGRGHEQAQSYPETP
jgi:hypothetical protein